MALAEAPPVNPDTLLSFLVISRFTLESGLGVPLPAATEPFLELRDLRLRRLFLLCWLLLPEFLLPLLFLLLLLL